MNTKILSALGIGMIAMLFLVSCQDEPSSSSKLTFKGVNNNAKALALVQEGNGSANAPRRMRADEGEKPQTKFLYTVDENGNMSAAIFYFNEVDSTTNTKALRLSIENIFSVGDDYLWFTAVNMTAMTSTHCPQGHASMYRNRLMPAVTAPGISII